MKASTPPAEAVRLDRWLWAARFYKTRALAVEAIDGGKVQVDGDRVKRAKQIRIGSEIRIRQGPYEQVVVARGLSDRRGPAAEAALLYEETAASREARERVAFQLKAVHTAFVQDEKVRPTKRDRRLIDRLRGKD